MSRSSTYVIDTSSMAIKEAEIEEGGCRLMGSKHTLLLWGWIGQVE